MANSNTNYSMLDKTTLDVGERSSELNIAAKLRRLKAEEIIMYKSLMKSETKDLHEENAIGSYIIYSKTENNIDDLKKSFMEIKKIFQDVKCRSLQESLKEIDIDDVKKDVMELDSKIISLKHYLSTELNSLKTAELEITKQLDEVTSENKSIKRRSSLVFKPNKDYILSPVKSLITTPARCLEVQKFQEFMMNSPNRYGGWIEYNHCIFMKIWEKYVKQQLTENDSVEEQCFFPLFLNEVLQKCHGITENDVVSHARWYAQYNILKESQQKAIKKWKCNKSKIKLRQQSNIETKKEDRKYWSEHVNNIEQNCIDLQEIPNGDVKIDIGNYHGANEDNNTVNIIDQSNKHILKNHLNDLYHKKNRDKLNYMKPTKQWTYRSVMYDDEIIADKLNNLHDLPKLCIPTWRLELE